mmetsp:Transcript_7582/g.19298  ORF Transcript_7582/g.19298 Transcript_7582/m.19298 type:complete len:475 (-) Transcript_7582:66-1490(-)
MEITLDAAEDQAVPPDVYLSLRVGESQKQSRFANSRVYHFPDPGEAKRGYARVEVFKRVGQALVNFSSLDGALKDCEVSCDLPDIADKLLRFRLGASYDQAKTSKQASAKKTPSRQRRLDEANRYLTEHNVEDTLQDAMADVINSRPSDPLTYLSDFLRAASRQGGRPKPEPLHEVAPSPLPGGDSPLVCPPEAAEAAKADVSAQEPELERKAEPPEAAPAPTEPEKQTEMMPEADAASPPPAPVEGETEEAAEADASAQEAEPEANSPSQPQHPVSPIVEYYAENFQNVTLPSLYTNFEGAATSPPTSPVAAPAEEQAEVMVEAEPATAPPPAPEDGEADKVEPEPPSERPFGLLPSVGTWLRGFGAEPSAGRAEEAVARAGQRERCSPQPLAGEAATTAAKTDRAPALEAAPLTPAAGASASRKKLVKSVQKVKAMNKLVQMDKKDIVSTMRNELSNKDKEIEELRKLLAST